LFNIMLNMVDVERRDHESLESLIRRFNRRVMQSSRLFDAREKRYYRRDKSRNLMRKDAVKSAEIKAERDLQRKLGKLPVREQHHRGSSY